MLYIVSTPIGNLADITFRAVEALKNVDLIAAEDTRHTSILTKYYKIKTPLTSYFEHNKVKKADYLIGLLKNGKSVALVTDAGTPGISDPGYRLIRLAKDHDIAVTVIPGACALVAALSLSGLASNNFIFEGFLPVKSQARKNKLKSFKEEERIIIFYESPHRIVKSLSDIKEVLQDPFIACAREITKKFEQVIEGYATDVIEHFSAVKPKGEFVLLVDNKRKGKL